jgi:SAM-dependent methyltransferase
VLALSGARVAHASQDVKPAEQQQCKALAARANALLVATLPDLPALPVLRAVDESSMLPIDLGSTGLQGPFSAMGLGGHPNELARDVAHLSLGLKTYTFAGHTYAAVPNTPEGAEHLAQLNFGQDPLGLYRGNNSDHGALLPVPAGASPEFVAAYKKFSDDLARDAVVTALSSALYPLSGLQSAARLPTSAARPQLNVFNGAPTRAVPNGRPIAVPHPAEPLPGTRQVPTTKTPQLNRITPSTTSPRLAASTTNKLTKGALLEARQTIKVTAVTVTDPEPLPSSEKRTTPSTPVTTELVRPAVLPKRSLALPPAADRAIATTRKLPAVQRPGAQPLAAPELNRPGGTSAGHRPGPNDPTLRTQRAFWPPVEKWVLDFKDDHRFFERGQWKQPATIDEASAYFEAHADAVRPGPQTPGKASWISELKLDVGKRFASANGAAAHFERLIGDYAATVHNAAKGPMEMGAYIMADHYPSGRVRYSMTTPYGTVVPKGGGHWEAGEFTPRTFNRRPSAQQPEVPMRAELVGGIHSHPPELFDSAWTSSLKGRDATLLKVFRDRYSWADVGGYLQRVQEAQNPEYASYLVTPGTRAVLKLSLSEQGRREFFTLYRHYRSDTKEPQIDARRIVATNPGWFMITALARDAAGKLIEVPAHEALGLSQDPALRALGKEVTSAPNALELIEYGLAGHVDSPHIDLFQRPRPSWDVRHWQTPSAAEPRPELKRVLNALPQVNPAWLHASASTSNCRKCVMAVSDLVAGRPFVAAPPATLAERSVNITHELEAHFGGRFETVAKSAALAQAVRKVHDAGPGAQAIVRVRLEHGYLHFFNIANIDGQVQLLDGQSNRSRAVTAAHIAGDPSALRDILTDQIELSADDGHAWARDIRAHVVTGRAAEANEALIDGIIDIDLMTVTNRRPAPASNEAEATGRGTGGFGKVFTLVGRFQDVRLPTDGSIDLVTSIKSLPHVPHHELPGVIDKVRRALAPGGHLVASFFGLDHVLRGAPGRTLLSESQIRDLLRHFDIVSLERVGREGMIVGERVTFDEIEVKARKPVKPMPGTPLPAPARNPASHAGFPQEFWNADADPAKYGPRYSLSAAQIGALKALGPDRELLRGLPEHRFATQNEAISAVYQLIERARQRDPRIEHSLELGGVIFEDNGAWRASLPVLGEANGVEPGMLAQRGQTQGRFLYYHVHPPADHLARTAVGFSLDDLVYAMESNSGALVSQRGRIYRLDLDSTWTHKDASDRWQDIHAIRSKALLLKTPGLTEPDRLQVVAALRKQVAKMSFSVGQYERTGVNTMAGRRVDVLPVNVWVHRVGAVAITDPKRLSRPMPLQAYDLRGLHKPQ